MNLKAKADKLKMDIPVVFIALRRKETPVLSKVLISLAVAYALSPIDLIPDFVPVLGYIDDIVILPLLLALAVKMIPGDVLDECRREAVGLWKDGKPKKWYYAIPVILLWLLIVFVCIKAIWF